MNDKGCRLEHPANITKETYCMQSCTYDNKRKGNVHLHTGNKYQKQRISEFFFKKISYINKKIISILLPTV